MKKLAFIFALFFPGLAYAGEATFTWNMPAPAWDDPQPPASWVINEVRLYCTITNSGQPDQTYNRSGIDPAASPLTYTDIPPGDMSCHMTAWSNGDGTMDLESVPSATVSKTIIPGYSPRPPAVFDFIPGVARRINPSEGEIVSTTSYQVAGKTFTVQCRYQASANNKLISVCEDI